MRGRIKINAEERRSLNSDNRIEIYLLGTSLHRNEELKGRLGGREGGGREGELRLSQPGPPAQTS